MSYLYPQPVLELSVYFPEVLRIFRRDMRRAVFLGGRETAFRISVWNQATRALLALIEKEGPECIDHLSPALIEELLITHA